MTTFSVDRTRSFLKIEESNLLSFYRSPHPAVPSADYCQGHLCDAFICVAHEYNLHRVYLALHDQKLKSNLVFISEPFRPDAKKLEALVREAHEFLENLGFTMEPVNISFSTATREVIIKDIKVLREPSLALQLDAAKMALEGLIAEKDEIARTASREQMELKTELQTLKGKLAASTAVQPVFVAALPAGSAAGNASARQAEPDALHTELTALGEERDKLRSRLDGAEQELLKVKEELGGVNKALKSAAENLKNAREEVKQVRKEQKLHKHESDSLHDTLKADRMELEKVRSERDALRRELQETRDASESARHGMTALHEELEAASQAETALLKAEMERLMAEVAAKNLDSSGETEVLRAALTEANTALSAEKAKNDSALQEMDALERNASAELKSLKKKVDTLTAEKQLLEKVSAEIRIKARGEIEQQQQLNQLQRKAAIKKLNTLKEEIRQLAEARAVIASPTGVSLVAPVASPPSLAADDRGNDQNNGRNEFSLSAPQAGFASDLFGSGETIEYINFLPDKTLPGIPYVFPADVVEIYRSYNTIQASPNGKQAQKCDGFVCLVKEGGHSLVYAAWVMNSSGETLICLPERVVDGDDSCRQMLREGIGYFERIGFVIDRFQLERDPEKRQIQLDDLAIFSRTVSACAA